MTSALSPSARWQQSLGLFDAGLVNPEGFARLLGLECTDSLRFALYQRAARISELQALEDLAEDVRRNMVSW